MSDLVILQKLCTICDKLRLVENFYTSKNTQDGYQPYCKACMKQKNTLNRKKREYEQVKLQGILAQNSELPLDLVKHCMHELRDAIIEEIKYCELSNKPAMKRALIESIESTTAIKYSEIVAQMLK